MSPYDLLYNNNKNGDRYKILNLNLIALRFYDDEINIENFFEYGEAIMINDDNIIFENDDIENDEMLIYNGNNELVKIFIEPICVLCLENISIFAFRNCGHLCLCEHCYKNTNITKCVICKS